jgi:hypothetical protein
LLDVSLDHLNHDEYGYDTLNIEETPDDQDHGECTRTATVVALSDDPWAKFVRLIDQGDDRETHLRVLCIEDGEKLFDED